MILKKVYLWLIEVCKFSVFLQIALSYFKFYEDLFFWSVCVFFILEYIKNFKNEYQYARTKQRAKRKN